MTQGPAMEASFEFNRAHDHQYMNMFQSKSELHKFFCTLPMTLRLSTCKSKLILDSFFEIIGWINNRSWYVIAVNIILRRRRLRTQAATTQTLSFSLHISPSICHSYRTRKAHIQCRSSRQGQVPWVNVFQDGGVSLRCHLWCTVVHNI